METKKVSKKRILAALGLCALVAAIGGACGVESKATDELLKGYNKATNDLSQALQSGEKDTADKAKRELDDLGKEIAKAQKGFSPKQAVLWVKLKADAALKELQMK